MNEIQRANALNLLTEAWTPHTGQIEVGKRVFNSPADLIYVECGRKWGKSEFGVYVAWMEAIMTDNAEVFYLAPLVKQARGIVWDNYRMQSCNTYQHEFIKAMEDAMGGPIKIFRQEMKIEFPNGSFIKCDGSDNVESQRGLKGDLIIGDEYRDFEPRWIEAVRPNMAAKSGKMLFITTPPHTPNHAYDLAEECKTGMRAENEYYYYLNMPSNTNDRIPGHDKWLEREKERLFRVGRANEWHREYMARYIPGDEQALIPQLNRTCLEYKVAAMESLRANLSQNADIELFLMVDPGNSTQIGALFCGFNPYTAEVYVFDEYKQWDSEKTAITQIMPDLEAIAEELGVPLKKWPEIWVNPNTPWWSRDLLDLYGFASTPAPKECKRLEYNASMLKDIILSGQLWIYKECTELAKESEKCIRNANNRLPNAELFPLLNCLRYLISACSYTSEYLERPKKKPVDEDWLEKMTSPDRKYRTIRDIMMEHHGLLEDIIPWQEGQDPNFL